MHVRRAGGFDGVRPITLLIVQTPKRNLIALPDDVTASVVRPNASSIAPALHLGTSTEVRQAKSAANRRLLLAQSMARFASKSRLLGVVSSRRGIVDLARPTTNEQKKDLKTGTNS